MWLSTDSSEASSSRSSRGSTRLHVRGRSGPLARMLQPLLIAAFTLGSAPPPAPRVPRTLTILADAWRIVESRSGPTNYYRVVQEAGNSFVRSNYAPPMKTAVLGWQTPDRDRQRVR